MKYIKRLVVISLIILFGIFIYVEYNLNDSVTVAFNKLFSNNSNNLFDIKGLGDLVNEDDIKSLKDSGIKGNDISINASYYPYYGMLNDNEKALYKQVYANANSIKSTFVPSIKVNSSEVNNAVLAVFYDHPELFWLDNEYSYKYDTSGKCVQIIIKFNDTSNNIYESKNRFNNVSNKIISGASKYDRDFDKEKYVHDYIVNNTSYNTNASLNQSAYSALVNKESVCAGYARAFQYLMIRMGIPTYYVVGKAGEDHAWNIVALDDGYYNVDVTWDDQRRITYNYFNRTDKQFSSSHVRRNLSLNLPSCNGVKYQYITSNNPVKRVIKKYVKVTPNDNNNNNNNTIKDEIKVNNYDNNVVDNVWENEDNVIDNNSNNSDTSNDVDNKDIVIEADDGNIGDEVLDSIDE